MWSFLKKVHLIVFALSLVGGVVLFFVFMGTLFSGGGIEKKSVLKITLDHKIVEHAPIDPLGAKFDFPISTFEAKHGVINLLQTLKKAKTDPNINSIFLEMRMINGGLGSIEEIRNAIIDFKTSGKKVIAYGDLYDEKAYYLVSAADQVFLTHEGILEFNGFVAEINFYKNLLNAVGLEPKIFRVGKFKGAVEPFMLDSISAENRLQIEAFLGSLHRTMIGQIATSRGLTPEAVKDISDNLRVRNAYQAEEFGLIDGVKYYDEVMTVLREASGISESEPINFVKAESYLEETIDLPSNNELAIIVADGEIALGKNQEGVIGSNGMAKLIREARLDPAVKAIVLRINSPGGSALGSDLMWREIKLASETKPIIASMSDMAASGGYYMAMACDTIVAHETTITGSIGVFGMLVNAEGLLKDKLKIHTDRVTTGKFSDLGTPTRQMTPEDSTIIQEEVNLIYEKFVTKAAEGRGMSVDDLKAVASGRVWSGAMALENGLVDVIGGLDVAIAIAKEKVGGKELDIKYYPRMNPIWGTIESGYKQAALPQEFKDLKESEIYNLYQSIQALQNMKGVQARMPFELEVK